MNLLQPAELDAAYSFNSNETIRQTVHPEFAFMIERYGWHRAVFELDVYRRTFGRYHGVFSETTHVIVDDSYQPTQKEMPFWIFDTKFGFFILYADGCLCVGGVKESVNLAKEIVQEIKRLYAEAFPS